MGPLMGPHTHQQDLSCATVCRPVAATPFNPRQHLHETLQVPPEQRARPLFRGAAEWCATTLSARCALDARLTSAESAWHKGRTPYVNATP